MEKEKDTREIKEVQKEPKMKSPIDFFFKMGEWATKGDPMRQQDFSYYMLWILFLAFVGLMITNIYRFVTTFNSMNLIWALVGFAISSLQYFNLKSFYQMRKARKDLKVIQATDDIEEVDEMLKGFGK